MYSESAEVTEDGSFWLGLVFLIDQGILGCFGIDCIHRLHYGRLIGGYPSEEIMDCIIWIILVSVFLGLL